MPRSRLSRLLREDAKQEYRVDMAGMAPPVYRKESKFLRALREEEEIMERRRRDRK